jgi:hypothetical protein
VFDIDYKDLRRDEKVRFYLLFKIRSITTLELLTLLSQVSEKVFVGSIHFEIKEMRVIEESDFQSIEDIITSLSERIKITYIVY